MEALARRLPEWALLAVLLGSATLLNLKPGKFQLTVTYEIQGQQPGQAKASSRCIAASDLDNPEKVFNDRVFAGFKADETCTVKNLRNHDGKIFYDADCSNRVTHVEATLGSTEFSAVRDVEAKSGRGVSLKIKLAGQRIGECEK